MSVPGLLITLFLAAVVFFIVIAPLLIRYPDRAASDDPQTERQRERLNTYYDRVLRNLRDLDEDHALGKIEPALYEQDRAVWVERGVQALKALELLQTLKSDRATLITPVGSAAGDFDRAIDDAIEAAVQRAKTRAE